MTPILCVSLLLIGIPFAKDAPVDPLKVATYGHCEDGIVALATVVPKMDCKFFRTVETSYRAEIVEHDNGNLEDTVDGTIDPEDVLRVEHTAQCSSSHQGDHRIDFSHAVATPDGVTLEIDGGGLPYCSSLTVMLDAKLGFTCSFRAQYPAPTNPLHWKVTKKTMRLKSTNLKAGSRIRGWISVEFDEIDGKTKETHSYKIEGYFKPVIQSASKDPPPKGGEQPGAGQPVTQPANKGPAELQPSTHTPKDGPR